MIVVMDVSPVEDGPTWSDIAAWYDQLLRGGSGPHETAVACLLGLVPDLAGVSVLDVACGQGLATRALAGAGAAHVIGADASEAMIALARGYPAPVGGEVGYVVDDAQRLAASMPGASTASRASSGSWTSPICVRPSTRSTGCCGRVAGSCS